MTAKVPRRPPYPLTRDDVDVRDVRVPLWRIHRTEGEHVLAWNGFRTYGPLPTGRYDPHPAAPAAHPGYGVLYAAPALSTALAETFQRSRSVNLSTGAPYATSWTPTRALRLVDLTGDWALRNGAAHPLAHAPRPTCRAWSRAIYSRWGDLDGLWAPSTLDGAPILALYERAHTATPLTPAFSRPLAHPLLCCARSSPTTLTRSATRPTDHQGVDGHQVG